MPFNTHNNANNDNASNTDDIDSTDNTNNAENAEILTILRTLILTSSRRLYITYTVLFVGHRFNQYLYGISFHNINAVLYKCHDLNCITDKYR